MEIDIYYNFTPMFIIIINFFYIMEIDNLYKHRSVIIIIILLSILYIMEMRDIDHNFTPMFIMIILTYISSSHGHCPFFRVDLRVFVPVAHSVRSEDLKYDTV